MWRRRKLGKKLHLGLEELRVQRRERETALRKARREQQLISKRLLRDHPDDEEFLEENLQHQLLSEQQVLHLIRDIQHGSADKLKSLTDLRHGLGKKDTQLSFIRVEGSMRVLIGLFTCQSDKIQMEAARCLHELSHSDDPAVSKACLPVTSYLLTYLSGSNAELTELCLYTLGNLIVESEAARHQLLLQGIIPAFAVCIQSPHMTVLEATGYALSQLLQAKEAHQNIVPFVLEAGLTRDILRLFVSDSEDGFGMMIEFAWCLHYVVSSQVNNALLISQDVVSKLVHLLTKLAGFLTNTNFPGSELLVCPLVRCLGNLLAEVDAAGNKVLNQEDGRLLVALFVFIQQFQKEHLFVVRECLWTLNNMTVKDPTICSAVLNFNLVPVMLQLLGHSKDINLLVLTVLCNIADLGPVYCQCLHENAILSRVIPLLETSDVQVTLCCLDLIIILLHYCPQMAKDPQMLSGLQILEPYKDHPEAKQHIQAVWNYCSSVIKEHSTEGNKAVE
ncbi:transmembrane and coiled-coil domain-containing protein 6 [Rana temporaria]|uniref:transmembrane and coiled-coil domain-containing protein 6 n=1 Tax=Rana temporaria TaxID=8407 RepID=UPI001AACEDC6|nr:transmembrane and coiled-coil domain-containing protein 6 [Rana temporaria]XP_040200754.1 transmembrane and coiled-coil domain-containing protein 6 [Rana temporaria]XP_040200755.1 transmembrane and coiled-coil domain-containing protein 6 [Rana temporaria]